MYNKYEKLNDNSRDYFLALLYDKVKDEKVLERCKKEINLLYDRNILFIIEQLHKYMKYDGKVSYHFRGMANNLLLLNIFGISKIDPLKYNLPYELFTDKTLSVDLINGISLDFVSFLEKKVDDFRIVKGFFEKCDVDEINTLEDNYYLLIPCYLQPVNMTFRLNEDNQFETIEDYHLFTDEYITIRIDDKPLIQQSNVDIKYALYSKFEQEVAKQLNPQTINDYAKIISLSHSAHVWKDNQEELFNNGKVDIHNIIATREDVYEYLLKHSIENNVALDIVKQLSKARTCSSNKLWKNYVNLMKEHKCDDMFIDILSKILFIFGRGQAISESLYALDENNYYDKD